MEEFSTPEWDNIIEITLDSKWICKTYVWYTYIHNWSLQPFGQDYWPSFLNYLCCVCVNYIYKWRDLQFKVDFERQIFWETFNGNFIYSQSFCQKSAERKLPKK